jgi:hypothetical protein
MQDKYKEFFLELAKLIKKHQCTAPFGSSLRLGWVDGNRVVGDYKITEIWIDREGEAVLRVKGENREFEIYSDGKIG